MAFRGRGRGRGGFGVARRAKNEPFILFPEDVKLPGIPTPSEKERDLIKRKARLERYWKYSPYYLLQVSIKSVFLSAQFRRMVCVSDRQDSEIRRYSDRKKPDMSAKREALSSYLKLTSSHFPVELLQGVKRVKHVAKWDQSGSELKKLDLFEKLEEKHQGQDGKEKKEAGSEGEEDRIEEEDEEESEDGDYNQNIDFDDDEDDLNMDDGDNDEPFYE